MLPDAVVQQHMVSAIRQQYGKNLCLEIMPAFSCVIMGYFISRNGDIFRARFIPKRGTRVSLVRQTPAYPTVSLHGQQRPVHRLVAEAFLGPAPEGKPLVRHLDNDPTNLAASNLRWGSHKENSADQKRRHKKRWRSHLIDFTDAQP